MSWNHRALAAVALASIAGHADALALRFIDEKTGSTAMIFGDDRPGDRNPDDLDARPGAMRWNGTIGDWVVDSLTVRSDPTLRLYEGCRPGWYSCYRPSLDIAVKVRSEVETPYYLSLEVSDTDYDYIPSWLDFDITGDSDGSVIATYYWDADNGGLLAPLSDDDKLGSLTCAGTDCLSFGVEDFSTLDPYSLHTVLTFRHDGAGASSDVRSSLGYHPVGIIPAPYSGLLGVTAIGVLAALRRRRPDRLNTGVLQQACGAA